MKFAKIATVGVVGVAALWSASWYAARALYVEPEADKAVEALRAGDLFFTYDKREISGFPFGYEVSYTNASVSDASKIWRWTVPTMAVKSGVVDGGALTLRPSDESQLTVDDFADGPEVFAVRTDGFALRLTADGDDTAFDAAAVTFALEQAESDSPLRGLKFELDGFTVTGAITNTGARLDADFGAARVGMAYALSMMGIPDSSSQFDMFDLTSKITLDGLDAESVAAFVNEKPGGAFDMAFSRFTGSGDDAGGLGWPASKMTYSGGQNTLNLALKDGVFSVKSSADDTVYQIEMEAPLPSGDVKIESMVLDLGMPLRKSDGPSAFSANMVLGDVDMAEGLWAALDPSKSLGRTPLSLNVDLGGTVRMLSEFGAPTPPGVPPVEVQTVSIRQAEIRGLDAALVATGELTNVAHPVMPEGEINIEMAGFQDLAERIVKSGLISEPEMAFYQSLILSYAETGEAPDTLVAKIKASPLTGVTINDKPL